jgi:ribosomal protein L37AE/L43A
MGGTRIMKVNAIKCPKCKDIVYSRAGHDFRECSCGGVFIDGGFDYVRMGFETELKGKVKRLDVEVKATKEELYIDWFDHINKFGLIKDKNIKK